MSTNLRQSVEKYIFHRQAISSHLATKLETGLFAKCYFARSCIMTWNTCGVMRAFTVITRNPLQIWHAYELFTARQYPNYHTSSWWADTLNILACLGTEESQRSQRPLQSRENEQSDPSEDQAVFNNPESCIMGASEKSMLYKISPFFTLALKGYNYDPLGYIMKCIDIRYLKSSKAEQL